MLFGASLSFHCLPLKEEHLKVVFWLVLLSTFCRLANDDSNNQGTSGIFICAVCQVDLAPSEGISVHAGAIFSTSSIPWQGPFLCADCRNKKDAMEGKRPSGVKVAWYSFHYFSSNFLISSQFFSVFFFSHFTDPLFVSMMDDGVSYEKCTCIDRTKKKKKGKK